MVSRGHRKATLAHREHDGFDQGAVLLSVMSSHQVRNTLNVQDPRNTTNALETKIAVPSRPDLSQPILRAIRHTSPNLSVLTPHFHTLPLFFAEPIQAYTNPHARYLVSHIRSVERSPIPVIFPRCSELPSISIDAELRYGAPAERSVAVVGLDEEFAGERTVRSLRPGIKATSRREECFNQWYPDLYGFRRAGVALHSSRLRTIKTLQ